MCSNVSAAQITQCWQTVDGIGNHMLNFLENHDEQRIASREFAGNAQLAIPALVVSATLSTGPMMVYAGQELGEKAEDAEGFSGFDGRTTIFDYWSVPSLRRWMNGGKCNNELLSDEEVRLRDTYKKVLNAAKNEPAISRGQFFDVMYVNYNNPTLDPPPPIRISAQRRRRGNRYCSQFRRRSQLPNRNSTARIRHTPLRERHLCRNGNYQWQASEKNAVARRSIPNSCRSKQRRHVENQTYTTKCLSEEKIFHKGRSG